MYTKKTLLQYNGAYNEQHRLTDGDVAIANAYKIMIEESRSNFGPKAGDTLLRLDGKYAHIEEVDDFAFAGNADHKMSICDNPYTPFVSASIRNSSPRIKCNTSGGPWESLTADKIAKEKHGTRKKTFVFFGHCGMRAGGGVEFRAKVNIWKEIE